MIVVPKRLFEEKYISVFHQSLERVALKKNFTQSLYERQSYLAMHAVSLIVEGTQHIMDAEGNKIRLASGDMAFLARGLYTVSDLVAENQQFLSYHLYFNDEVLRRICKDFVYEKEVSLNAHPGPVVLKQGTVVPMFLESLDVLAATIPTPHPLLWEHKFYEFFALLASFSESRDKLSELVAFPQRSHRSINDIMQAYYDKPLTILDFAYLNGKSSATFRRDFKARYDISPRKWIIQKRMEKAKELLTRSDLSVHELAKEVGYDNVSHFIKAFKREYGFTPGTGSMSINQ